MLVALKPTRLRHCWLKGLMLSGIHPRAPPWGSGATGCLTNLPQSLRSDKLGLDRCELSVLSWRRGGGRSLCSSLTWREEVEAVGLFGMDFKFVPVNLSSTPAQAWISSDTLLVHWSFLNRARRAQRPTWDLYQCSTEKFLISFSGWATCWRQMCCRHEHRYCKWRRPETHDPISQMDNGCRTRKSYQRYLLWPCCAERKHLTQQRQLTICFRKLSFVFKTRINKNLKGQLERCVNEYTSLKKSSHLTSSCLVFLKRAVCDLCKVDAPNFSGRHRQRLQWRCAIAGLQFSILPRFQTASCLIPLLPVGPVPLSQSP